MKDDLEEVGEMLLKTSNVIAGKERTSDDLWKEYHNRDFRKEKKRLIPRSGKITTHKKTDDEDYYKLTDLLNNEKTGNKDYSKLVDILNIIEAKGM